MILLLITPRKGTSREIFITIQSDTPFLNIWFKANYSRNIFIRTNQTILKDILERSLKIFRKFNNFKWEPYFRVYSFGYQPGFSQIFHRNIYGLDFIIGNDLNRISISFLFKVLSWDVFILHYYTKELTFCYFINRD